MGGRGGARPSHGAARSKLRVRVYYQAAAARESGHARLGARASKRVCVQSIGVIFSSSPAALLLRAPRPLAAYRSARPPPGTRYIFGS